MSNFDFPETKLRSQNPGGNGPLFTMSLDDILGRGRGSVGDLSGGRGERGRLVVDLRTSQPASGAENSQPSENTNRDQILGAMVAGAQAGAQHIADTTPQPVLISPGAGGAGESERLIVDLRTSKSAKEAEDSQPSENTNRDQILGAMIAGVQAGAQYIANTTLAPLTKELQSPPPSHPELTASRSVEDLQRLIEALNASPLMYIPEELAEGGGRHPLAPHVSVRGWTLGQGLQAFMRPGMPTGAFALYNPEGEYVSSFHPVPLTGGPITGFGDIFQRYSVGGVFTVPAYDGDGNVEVGGGGVAAFELPGGIRGMVFANFRGDPAEITDGNFILSFQGGVVINASSVFADVTQSSGRTLQTVPKPGVIAAGRVIEGTGRAIDFIDEYLMSYYLGVGYRMEAHFEGGKFKGIYIGGQRVELEDIVEQLLTHSDHFDTPPLIPTGGNPVIEAHNNRMQMAYGRSPVDIAYELQDQPTENSAVQIAQRYIDFVENTMRPNAHLLSEGLQRRINLPLTSVNDFGPIYDAFVSQVEALGMG
ncbi:MAG: hypothetical protein ACXIVE_00245, partial [Salinarimonas sp.]